MPLRETRGSDLIGPDGTSLPGRPIIYYQPFTTTDLLNWKHHTPAYSEKPQVMTDLMESIFQTHQLTWEDCQQLLRTLFNNEERRRILQEARKWLEEMAPGGVTDTGRWANEAAPDKRPDWDFNTEEGRSAIRRYPEAILRGLRQGAKKPTNMSKTADVTQDSEETPGDFYERLCEAFRIYARFDPEAPENQRMVNAAFVAQSAPDSHRKLQKLEGFAGMNITQLLEVANKVFRNRDSVAKREADKRMRQKATLLAAALQQNTNQRKTVGQTRDPGQPRRMLKKDQCAYCKEMGHWKNECPNWRQPQPRSHPRPTPPSEKEPEFIGLAGIDSD
ncbi:hypothetical protein mRhiFer1_008631 [Rhinolophus ferrumequinum]|uniref:CCHC-type domain-containing protein n=1 Tax=Rhinolophus ferrumequinum TaxID=59479 RepID=A0A7J7U119_RHIFE|nr:hypothetical protein mRhiFer1_008631 [Rhinolophus ferrumequinum]